MFERADYWSELLWNYYLPQIEIGSPFYLAADSSIIAELSASDGNDSSGQASEALEDFRAACAALMRVHKTRATVEQSAFEQISGQSFSRSICLAVQQVLVVELMLHDKQYSEQSYFPRYRYYLGLVGGNQHENPLGVSFQKIWNTLSAEISAVQGSSATTITFGPGAGRNLNSNYPLSQALFTHHDLSLIVNKAPWLADSRDDATIIQSLYQVRRSLGRRAQNLILKSTTTDQMRSRLSAQIQSFIEGNDFLCLPTKAPNVSREQERILAFLDPDDIFQETFSLCVKVGSGQDAGTKLTEAISQRLQRSKAIILVACEDHYAELSAQVEFEPGDSILAVIRNADCEFFSNLLFEIYGTTPLQSSSNLSTSFALLQCGAVNDNRLLARLGITTKVQQSTRLRLAGGLYADAKLKTFLCGYPPTAIEYDSAALSDETIIRANQSNTTVGDFLEKLKHDRTFSAYSVEVGGDRIEFAIGSCTLNVPASRLGYALNCEQLAPSCSLLEDDQLGLVGTTLVELALAQSPIVLNNYISLSDLNLLAKRGKRISIPESTVVKLLQSIDSFEGHDRLKEAVTKQIRLTRSIPLRAVTTGWLRKL